MDLLLWRHAEAEERSRDGSDLTRELTPKGLKQAAMMARWLHAHGPKAPRILVSPARRTQQTASALERPFETCNEIAPDRTVADLIRASGWPGNQEGTVILVGHQPTLGQLAAKLLTGKAANWSVKKGGLWWLQGRNRGGVDETVLKLVLPSELT